MNIRVFTDLRFASPEAPTGVGKHVYQMARGLANSSGCQVSLLAASDQAAHPGVLDFLPASKMPLSWKASSALWAATSRPYADDWCGDADWVYCPKNDWIPLRAKRLAVTIHGAHELDPAMPRIAHPLGWLYRLRNRVQYLKMCRRADVVFTVSEFLRVQVMEWFYAAPEKVVVIGNGIDPAFFVAGQQPAAPLALPYLLALGGLNHLDGGDRILAVADELAGRGLGTRIHVAGIQHDPALMAAARAHPNVELLGYVQSERLAPLMAGADALLYLTRYETFGMGAAEAMACGTPVITCHNTAVPEVVGDAGIYVDPEDPAQVVSAMYTLQTDPIMRKKYVARGHARATGYTWEACVEKVRQELQLRMNG